MMKLSDATVGVLKNFANINQNILIEEGKQIRTMSTMKNILATAPLTEEFPRDVGIYDLNEFLGVLSMAKDADIQFEDSHMTVSSGKTKIKYMYSDPSILTVPPQTFNAPEEDRMFRIDKDELQNILKASAVMQLPDITLVDRMLTATDLKNTTSNNYSIELQGDFALREHRLHWKAENLKMVPDFYRVGVSETANVSHWVNGDTGLDYWIAMEAMV